MAPTEKDERRLARDYGLDISMPEVNIAVSSAAQKEYQKKCNYLYKEFQKTMNFYHKEEQMIKKDLNKLNREKVLNNQYSLYRSAGSDLFSKANKKRQLFMKKNIGTVSPLFDDMFFNTPWGLDSIVDEDLIRPNTAPATGSVEELIDLTSPRPKTSVNPNDKITTPNPPQMTVSPFEYKCQENQVEKSEIKPENLFTVRTNQTRQPNSSDQKTDEPVTVPDYEMPSLKLEEIENADGEVDPQTERTRARKITINAQKFNKLQNGDVNVTLKDKDGDYLIKPVRRKYTPEGVDAVFVAKDPSKEVTALVRQNTNWESPTVAAELKVNNRIAIQKSLMGKNVRKTTVAEIFNGARNRKTRHFRVVLKNPNNAETAEKPEADANDKTNKQATDSPVMHIYKHQKKLVASMTGHSKIQKASANSSNPYSDKREGKPIVNESVLHDKQRGMRVVITPVMKDDQCDRPNTSNSLGHVNRRRDSISSIIRGPSSIGHNDPMNTSGHHRVSFGRMPSNEPVDNPDAAAHQRSASSMSMREGGVQFCFTDDDMTEMIQKVLEGGGTRGEDIMDRSGSNMSLGGALKALRMVQNISRLANRRRPSVTPETMSISEKSASRDVPSRVSSRKMARQIIKDQRKQDEAYESAMMAMRRRVALGAGRRSNTGFR